MTSLCRFIISTLAMVLLWENAAASITSTPQDTTEAATIRVVLTANTATLADMNTLWTAIDTYSTQTRQTIVWVLNGDIFPAHDNEAARQANWETALRLLEKHAHLTILLNQGEGEWDNGKADGWQHLQRLEKEAKHYKYPRLLRFFEHGCPGPWNFTLGTALNIMVLNTQWWNHRYEKPMPYMDLCHSADENVFLEAVTDQLEDSKARHTLILTHWPLQSAGPYGGHFPAAAYWWPPVAGAIRVAFRQTVGTPKDLVNARYDAFRHKLDNTLSQYHSLIVASGHERSHAILKEHQNFYLNSGAPAEGSFVANLPNAVFTSSQPGFMELSYKPSGAVHWRFIQPNGTPAAAPDEPLIGPIEVIDHTDPVPFIAPLLPAADSGYYHVVAGPEYAASTWTKCWLGQHYRASWTAPVLAPMLNIDTTFQGLSVQREGGGRQTRSLKMMAGNGQRYVFRSVNKDPSKALDPAMRGTVVEAVVKDQTSTQQPYGAMAASYLLDKIDILHARPHLYVLPGADTLAPFRSYAHMLGMLEEGPTDKLDPDKVFAGARRIERSHKLFTELYEDHDNHIRQAEFCRARVFDILVGDWGKHEDNWKWAGYKIEGGDEYRPIPRDRDHVFSRWDGVIPYLADREWAKPTGENFDYTIKGLRSLMQQATHMDRLLTNTLTREDWLHAAQQIQQRLTAEDMDQAVHQMPDAIQQPDGALIADKLKARLKDLPVYAEAYYEMLAKRVDVVGSNKAEYFHVTRHLNGSVEVFVCDLDHGKPNRSRVFFHRTFLPTETKEICLYGLLDEDEFVITGHADQSIRVRIICEDAADHIADSSSVTGASHKTYIYRPEAGKHLHLGTEARRIVPKHEDLYYYDRTAFAYNTYFPLALVTYSPFIGLTLKSSVTFTNHNFSKPDFSTRHTMGGGISVEGNYEVQYQGRFRYLVGKWDGVGEAGIAKPFNVSAFFGIGNDTYKAPGSHRSDYGAGYNARHVQAGLTRSFWKRSKVLIDVRYEYADGVISNTALAQAETDLFGLDPLDIVTLEIDLDLDFRDSPNLPTRGFRMDLQQQVLHMRQAQQEIGTLSSLTLEHYISTRWRHPVTVGIAAGGGISQGDIPFYKLFSLGQTNGLHGYVTNRFTGSSRAYVDTEIRWQLLETHHTFIPFKAGIRGFYDMGRVWADTDLASAEYWHQGYGAGVYVAPFANRLALEVNTGFSDEEDWLLNFKVGASF